MGRNKGAISPKKAADLAWREITAMPSRPPIPTAKIETYSDGRIRGIDGSVWAYFAVPMAPTVEAKTISLRLRAADPLYRAIEGIASLTRTGGIKNRKMSKGDYRDIHLLEVSLRRYYSPPSGHPSFERLSALYGDKTVSERFTLLGVRLIPKLAASNMKDAIASVVEQFVTPDGAPLRDFDADFERVNIAMSRAGLQLATRAQIEYADNWWNSGQNAATPIMSEPDRLHVFSSASSARAGQDLYYRGIDPAEWPVIDGHHAIRFGAVEDINIDWADAISSEAGWWAHLIDSGAMCVSLRAKVEPGTITAKELDRQRKAYIADINERYKENKLDKIELEEKEQTLSYLRTLYRGNNPPPTIIEARITFAMPESYGAVEEIGSNFSAMSTAEMTSRQMLALKECWLTSPVRANPIQLEMPLTLMAHSGCVSLSRVGDSPDKGCLVGMTEADSLPAYFDPRSAMDQDAPPLFGIYGASGSGKTMLGLWIGHQYSWQRPTIFVNPKAKSSLAPSVLAAGGTVANLSDLVDIDGILDPIRFSKDGFGLEFATSMLASVNPWGPQLSSYETPLQMALAYGIRKGHRSIGTCLVRALKDGVLDSQYRDMVDRVVGLAKASSLFRAMCGLSDRGEVLSAGEGLTLIEVGDMSLPLPDPGSEAETQTQRVAINLVRMLVKGCSSALMNRDGLVLLDEAWIFLGSTASEIDQLGRLARSQRVAVGLLTQKVSDAQEANLEEFLTTGFIGPMKAEKEAVAACVLSHLEPTEERIDRITAPGKIKGTAGDQNNWSSMRHLMKLDKNGNSTRQVERGSIFIFSDIYDQAIPVEVRLPDKFLAAASTNKADIDLYKASEPGSIWES